VELEPLYVDERACRLTFPVHQALHDAWANQRRRWRVLPW